MSTQTSVQMDVEASVEASAEAESKRDDETLEGVSLSGQMQEYDPFAERRRNAFYTVLPVWIVTTVLTMMEVDRRYEEYAGGKSGVVQVTADFIVYCIATALLLYLFLSVFVAYFALHCRDIVVPIDWTIKCVFAPIALGTSVNLIHLLFNAFVFTDDDVSFPTLWVCKAIIACSLYVGIRCIIYLDLPQDEKAWKRCIDMSDTVCTLRFKSDDADKQFQRNMRSRISVRTLADVQGEYIVVCKGRVTKETIDHHLIGCEIDYDQYELTYVVPDENDLYSGLYDDAVVRRNRMGVDCVLFIPNDGDYDLRDPDKVDQLCREGKMTWHERDELLGEIHSLR